MTRIALAAALLAASSTNAFAGTPSYDVAYAASSTQQYAILKNTGMSLSEARSACKKEGFKLATINDFHELDFIENALATVHGNYSWLEDVTRVISLHARSGEGYSIENGVLQVRPDNYAYGAVCEK